MSTNAAASSALEALDALARSQEIRARISDEAKAILKRGSKSGRTDLLEVFVTAAGGYAKWRFNRMLREIAGSRLPPYQVEPVRADFENHLDAELAELARQVLGSMTLAEAERIRVCISALSSEWADEKCPDALRRLPAKSPVRKQSRRAQPALDARTPGNHKCSSEGKQLLKCDCGMIVGPPEKWTPAFYGYEIPEVRNLYNWRKWERARLRKPRWKPTHFCEVLILAVRWSRDHQLVPLKPVYQK